MIIIFKNKANPDFKIEIDGCTKNVIQKRLIEMCREPSGKWEEVK